MRYEFILCTFQEVMLLVWRLQRIMATARNQRNSYCHEISSLRFCEQVKYDFYFNCCVLFKQLTLFFYEGRNGEGSGIVLESSVDEVCARNIAASSRSVSKSDLDYSLSYHCCLCFY